jgi:hypothetical protein
MNDPNPTRLHALAETSREAARKFTDMCAALNEAECTTLAAKYGLMAAEALATAQAAEAGAEAMEREAREREWAEWLERRRQEND